VTDDDHDGPPPGYYERRAKTELRKRLRGLRNTTPASACDARSQRIVERLLAMDALKGATRVALFWPIVARHEVDLRPLDEALRARGARVAYPAIDPETNAMTFRFVPAAADLEVQGYGFAEPAADAEEATELDAVLVPALALDSRGHRLGYGAGYYDRTLPRFCPPAVSIGVAYDFQLLVELPVTEGDVACDWIVTDTRVLAAER
jgi:5-formyltetrahydrofolate cyclo-ligase